MGEESFALIEKKITDLVQVVTALKKEKEAFAGELARKDGEVKELTGNWPNFRGNASR